MSTFDDQTGSEIACKSTCIAQCNGLIDPATLQSVNGSVRWRGAVANKRTLHVSHRSASVKPGQASSRPKNVLPKRSGAAKKQLGFASVEALIKYVLAMEYEAAERYAEFADAMELHNNLEAAELFRKLSRIEFQHRQQILDTMDWKQTPITQGVARRTNGPELAETADYGSLHYQMQPYHVLKLALQNELRAQKLFASIARTSSSEAVRETAAQLAREEDEHVRLIEEWVKRTTVPSTNCALNTEQSNKCK